MPSKSSQKSAHSSDFADSLATTAAKYPLLGKYSVGEFLQKIWHKKPLLIRQAFSPEELAGLECSPATLFQLSQQEAVETRLLTLKRGRWQMQSKPTQLPSLQQKKWTLLVQGVNLHHPPAAALLERFRFLPDVRLDDVMVSYATDGGGVGPHFDSYDVFLLQLHGQRRWRISAQKDLTLKPNLPLKILQNFEPQQEWILQPGDMLYLPPRYAHDGIAKGECMTLSVGFRAPSYNELAQNFYSWLAEQLDIPGMVEDANLLDPNAQPARVPDWLVSQFTHALRKAQPTADDIQIFLGEYFSEPKPTTFFRPPTKPPTATQFARILERRGLQLAAQSRLLYDAQNIYCNGQSLSASGLERRLLVRLANQHQLSSSDYPQIRRSTALLAQLHDWYCCGWLVANEA